MTRDNVTRGDVTRDNVTRDDVARDAPPPPAAAAPPADREPLAHRAQFAAFRAVLGLLRRMDWKRASRLGGVLGRIAYRPLGIRRQVVERQVAAAFPELSRADHERIARGAYEHLGRLAIETALLPELGRDDILTLVTKVDGWEALEAARAEGRGLLIAIGHLGNWEVAGAYLAARGLAIDAVARRMSNTRFDDYLTETRERMGITVVYDQQAARRTPRSLAQGRAVVLMVDQGVKNLASTYVPFFGRPAKTPRGPAVFALRLGAPLIGGVALRQPDGTFHLHIERLTFAETGDREADIDRIAALYTAALERWVRRAPEQYFWHHRRWRRQPKGTPLELRDPTRDDDE